MKITLLSILAAFSVAVALPSYAAEDDSLTKKAVKVKVLKDADDDSALKKATKVKATGEVVKDKDDSLLRKVLKLKILQKAAD